MAGLLEQDITILNVTEGSVIVEFTLAYGSAEVLLQSAVSLYGQLGGYAVIGYGTEDNCTFFIPDSLSSLFSPTLDVSQSGFVARDVLRLVIKSPFVISRSNLTFSIGSCPAYNVSIEISLCRYVYNTYFNWIQIWNDNCAPVITTINGDTKEFILFLKATFTETFPDLRKRNIERTVSENLAFRIAIPTFVTIKTLNQTLLPPSSIVVKGIVVSRMFDAQSHTGTLILRTKTEKPGYLTAVRVSDTLAGVTTSIVQVGNFNVSCPNATVNCIQEWQLTSVLNPNMGVCKLDDVYTVKWNTTCHYPCSATGEEDNTCHILFLQHTMHKL